MTSIDYSATRKQLELKNIEVFNLGLVTYLLLSDPGNSRAQAANGFVLLSHYFSSGGDI